MKWNKVYMAGCLLIFVVVMSGFVMREEAKPITGAVNSQEVLRNVQQNEVKESETATLELYAQTAVLFDAEANRVLYGKEQKTPHAMASTTKIMTCILALELGDLDEYCQVSEQAVRTPKVHIGVSQGEYYQLKDLLYSLMLESHNDAAVIIAEHVGGSTEKFAKLMNEKARQIGCEDTYFITPNGLDAEDEHGTHHTTAEDLAKIMAYCVEKSPKRTEFLAITQTDTYEFSNYAKQEDGSFLTGKHITQCHNHNLLLHQVEGVISGKTGFTGEAGYCYVGALQKGEHHLIVVVLGSGWPSHKNYKWEDAKELLEYGMGEYQYTCFPTNDEIEPEKIGVLHSAGVLGAKVKQCETMVVTKEEDFGLPGMLVGKGEAIQMECVVKSKLEAPVCAGDEVGSITYWLGDQIYHVKHIIAKETIERSDYQYWLQYVIERYFLSTSLQAE